MNIKKKLSVSLLAGFFAMVSLATAEAQIKPKFGVKGGVNYSTFNNVDGVEYKPGILAGVYADLKIPMTPMSVQPEVLFTQYGADIEDTDASFNVNYLQVPVLLKFDFQSPLVKPNVFFGPYAGFNLSSEIKNNDASLNLNDETQSTDFGVVIGAGVDIRKFRVGVRYTAGLTNVADQNFNDDAKNGAFALTAGVSF